MENCGRADSLQNEKHCFPTVFVYGSCCLFVVIALRPQVKAEIVCQNKFYKCRKPVGAFIGRPH